MHSLGGKGECIKVNVKVGKLKWLSSGNADESASFRRVCQLIFSFSVVQKKKEVKKKKIQKRHVMLILSRD